ncbi:hypothetical protein GGE67_001951 [Rhizobium leucaenae]|uniref:Bacterial transglutaminase-like N-terminal domain-containing protein n=1 Tax=Rhizobium leucaenae TaxID=29450 RepID=A0A7W7EK12_9HYPH|nr:hypothetical protein [Rhizobium leucaenae]MBB6301342.1 hypothetical protein [Rhizobium leucaenae]
MTIFSVRHVTSYRYFRAVAFGERRVMFRPRDSFDQRLIEESLVTYPEPRRVRRIHDVFGHLRRARRYYIFRPRTAFRNVDHARPCASACAGFPDRQRSTVLTCPFSYDADVVPDLEPAMHCHCADPNDEIRHWARQFVRHGQPTEIGHLLMTRCYAIRESFSCARRLEDRTETPVQTLSLRSGSCRDFALLMMEAGAARSGSLRAS